MAANQYDSALQYRDSFITECNITNNIINIGSKAELNHQVEVAVSDPVRDEKTQEKVGYVRLILDGTYKTEKSEDACCKYHMIVQGSFAVKDSMSDTDFVKMLWFNGSATMYGIARAKMEVISTTVLNNGKISLPMINMLEVLKEQWKKENPEDEK